MAKKTTNTEWQKEYIALDIIGSPDGTQRWMPGAAIWLSDAKALPLLLKGSIEPAASNTNPPQPAPELVQVVEAGQSAALNEEATNGGADGT